MDEAGEGDGSGGGSGYKPAEDDKKPDGPVVDENGYEVEGDKKPAEDDKKAPEEDKKPAEDDKKSEDTKTGYGDKKPAEDDKKPAEDDDDSNFEIIEPGDLLSDEISDLKKFIKENKLTKEQAKALVNSKKAEVANYKKLAEDSKVKDKEEIEETRKSWVSELKDDKDFGGEHFNTNIKKVDRVIEEFLPNLRKQLTEEGGMLPPYIMKDISNLANILFSTDKVVSGDKPKGDSDKEKEDPLSFYE